MSKEMTAVSVKEPLMHISKRDGIEPYKAWLIRLAAVLISLIVCAGVIFALTGLNPIEVYKGVFDGAVGTKRRVWMTIRDTLVLLCIAIGITPAFKMRFWNIGAEGQVLIGGVTSAAMMIYLGNSLPPVLLFPLMLAGSALSAMVWAAIPAFFKAYWNTNETLFTLMMNYVAMQVITYCIIFWENPKGYQLGGHHQLCYKRRLASQVFWTGLWVEPGNRSGSDPGHVHLPEIQQAGV